MVPDEGKLGVVGFFASVNLLNPTGVWGVSRVPRQYVERSCWPHKENFCDEEMGLSSLKGRQISLKIALKWKRAKSQKMFKSCIEGRQPCIYIVEQIPQQHSSC